jgi:hypothetical protein
LVTSPITAFIDIVTVQRHELDDAGGQVLGEGAVDHAHQPVVDGHRCSRVAGLPAHLIENGAR